MNSAYVRTVSNEVLSIWFSRRRTYHPSLSRAENKCNYLKNVLKSCPTGKEIQVLYLKNVLKSYPTGKEIQVLHLKNVLKSYPAGMGLAVV